MTRPYSLDLRERVVRTVEAGLSRHTTAARFDVSPSFVIKLSSRRGFERSPHRARLRRAEGADGSVRRAPSAWPEPRLRSGLANLVYNMRRLIWLDRQPALA